MTTITITITADRLDIAVTGSLPLPLGGYSCPVPSPVHGLLEASAWLAMVAALWERVYGKGSWERDRRTWRWVIKFSTEEAT